jgi:hypothetical protein
MSMWTAAGPQYREARRLARAGEMVERHLPLGQDRIFIELSKKQGAAVHLVAIE